MDFGEKKSSVSRNLSGCDFFVVASESWKNVVWKLERMCKKYMKSSFPRHLVIFSADDWVVQSPPQDGI